MSPPLRSVLVGLGSLALAALAALGYAVAGLFVSIGFGS